jgi:hypothetical protein
METYLGHGLHTWMDEHSKQGVWQILKYPVKKNSKTNLTEKLVMLFCCSKKESTHQKCLFACLRIVVVCLVPGITKP